MCMAEQGKVQGKISYGVRYIRSILCCILHWNKRMHTWLDTGISPPNPCTINKLKALQLINIESVSTQYTRDHPNKYQEHKFC